MEAYQVRATVDSSFEADTLNRLDAGLMVGEPIQEIVEATQPFKGGNDVSNWTTTEATRYYVTAASIRREYFAGTMIAGLASPTFLYGIYASFWKFIVHGERTGPMPSLRTGPYAFLATAHASPTPWGIDYRINLLSRLRDNVLEIAPHLGRGPGGCFMALDADVVNLRLSPSIAVGGRVGIWRQPQLSVTSNGNVLGAPTSGIGSLGGLSSRARASNLQNGIDGHALVRWDHESWFVGVRADAKSTGLHDLSPIASDFELTALVGLRLGRP